MELELKPIKTEEDYHQMLKEVDKVFTAKPNTPEGDRLEMLVMLIEHYEAKHHAIAPPDPIEAIKFRMDQLGISVSDFEKIIGNRTRAAEILSRKRKLTLPITQVLWKKLDIPAEVLVQEYGTVA